ncbi:bifunctional oligoribonuclease/PAP phosphatase NrnA [Candidatus Peregrinibacteria bacterium]|nr:bifunctional oligoribonuclease/PAP phosphatase NrnA [Candidatus Peregrinibacteria bacterium]
MDSATILDFMEMKDFQPAISLIQNAKNVLIVSHKRPDGDTLGASVAVQLALAQLGKKSVLACVDEIPSRLSFIPKTESFVKEFNLEAFDLIIINDAGAHHMTGFHEKYPDFLSKRIPIINIDHHLSNDGFGTINLIDTNASCASMIVWKLIKMLPVQITKEMALALLAGIYNDTGGFMHANTTQESFEISAELCKTGVKVTDVVRPLFKRSTLPQLRLWGFVLENMHINDNKVLSSVVSKADLYEMGAHSSDTGGIIDLMNNVAGVKFSMLLAEDDGLVKGSMRTQRDDINLDEIAGQFGGGGHRKAAGFRINGRLEKQVVWKVVQE